MKEPEAERLIDGYLDGTATPEQIEQLDARLQADGRIRRELLREAATQTQLRVLLRAVAEAEEAAPAAVPAAAAGAGAAEHAPAGAERNLRFPRRLTRLALPLAIAAGAMLALGVGFLWKQHQAGNAASARNARSGQPAAAQAKGLAPLPAWQRAPSLGSIVSVDGSATWTTRGAETATVRAGEAFVEGDRLIVGRDGTVSLQYADGTKLRLYRGSVVRFASVQQAKRLAMEQGAMDAVVVPQPTNALMVAQTAVAEARVRGTEFRMLAGTNSCWLGVKKGAVDLTRRGDGRTIRVTDTHYSAVTADWPFANMTMAVCPVWQRLCVLTTGDPYPQAAPRPAPQRPH
jgi:hypothetical protein